MQKTGVANSNQGCHENIGSIISILGTQPKDQRKFVKKS